MTRISKPVPAVDPARKQAVIYARVSSKEQEKEGFSIPAQLKLLKEYAAAQGFTIAQEYVDVETAKQTGRTAFGEMVAYLKAHPAVRVMLVEKTDRLYRNLKDWVTVDELEVEIHFPKEGVVLSRESRSSEKFMHGIKVLMAKNTWTTCPRRRGRGCWRRPSRASGQPTRRSAIATSPAPTARRLRPRSRTVARHQEAVRMVCDRPNLGEGSGAQGAKAAGLIDPQDRRECPREHGTHTSCATGSIPASSIGTASLYQGSHDPLVSVELWERVQAVMDGRDAKKAKQRHA